MRPPPVPARYFDMLADREVRCRLCPHLCRIRPGGIGICGIRKNRDGDLFTLTYGGVTTSAYDPIEKKPLYHFFPGRPIFSIGGWGCNLKCTFCQNSAISQYEAETVFMAPSDVARLGMDRGSVGVAYTYNEPVIAIEYVMDCARAVREAGGKNVLVTNGFIEPGPLQDLLPLMDAMNIDIKAFNNDFYRRLCGGELETVLEVVTSVVGKTHVELTTLVIPEENDAVPEFEDLAKWVAEHCGRAIPCHLTAYHPSYHYSRAATTAAHLANARRIFKKYLDYVYLGNIRSPGAGDTVCVNCGHTVVSRVVFTADMSGMNPDGTCANCGTDNHIIVG